MKKVKINYEHLSTAKLITRANDIKTGMTSNVRFPAPPVTMIDFAAQIVTVTTAAAAASNRDLEKLAVLREQKEVLIGMIRKNGEYVNTVAAGEDSSLQSSGYQVTKKAEKNQPTEGIDKIDAAYTNVPQTIELGWSKAKHARYYNVFISSNGGDTWTLYDTVFGRKLLVEALQSGSRYMFKVVPVGRMGDGPESDIASQLAS